MQLYIEDELRREMGSNNFHPKEMVPDGKIHRFDRGGAKNAWYVCHCSLTRSGKEFAVIVYGDWKEGLSHKYKVGQNFSDDEKIEIRRFCSLKFAEAENELKNVNIESIAKAKKLWGQSFLEGEHPYLSKKKIDNLFGARLHSGSEGYALVLAMRNTRGELTGVQKIFEDKKRFLSGQKNTGNFVSIPDKFNLQEVREIFVVEGFATGASIHMATKKPVICAISAGNLTAVCWEIKKTNPQIKIIIAGDDDRRTSGNPGKTNALRAAEEVGATVVFPKLEGLDDKFSDFNDTHCFLGLENLREQLKEVKAVVSTTPPAMILASQYIKQNKLSSNEKRLIAWKTDFYQFTSKCYEKLIESDLVNDIIKFIQRHPLAWKKAGKTFAKEILSNIEAKVNTDANNSIPHWIDNAKEAVGDIISLSNGSVDLTRVESVAAIQILPNSSELFQTTTLPFDFDPQAKCEKWISFLDEIIPDRETQMSLQEWFGLNLVYDTSFQKFAIFYGQGANGKSVCCVVLRALLGEKNVSGVNLEAFDPKRTFTLAATVGKLANIVEELNVNSKTEEGEIKKFVSGSMMTIEKKNKDPFEAIPTARLTFATNTLPNVSDSSDGLWRRILLYPFKYQTLDPQRQDRNLVTEKFWVEANELPGIFNWAVEGLFRLRRNKKFTISTEMSNELSNYKAQSNPTKEFLLENCEFKIGKIISTLKLYEFYADYMKVRGYQPFKINRFNAEVALFFPEAQKPLNAILHEGVRCRVWLNLGLQMGVHT
ncbi:MAG: phage/plasmid primase, P4 family [Pseudobdellovibrio sp.]